MKTTGKKLHFILWAICIGSIVFKCSPGQKKNGLAKPSTTLDYSLTGKGNKTLLFIHGWCINKTYWNKQAEYFKNDYRVLTLDLAGHGRSKASQERVSIDAYAKDVVELIDLLKLDSIILVAHSMSGNIAFHIYNSVPGKIIGFVGVDNLHSLGMDPTNEELKQTDDFFKMMEKDFLGTVKQFAENNLFSSTTTAEIKNKVLEDFKNSDQTIAIATLLSLQQEYRSEKTLAPKLKIPLFLILSDNGKVPLVNKESLDKFCGTGYKVYPIQGTGHYPMIEAPAEFNKALQGILAEIKSGSFQVIAEITKTFRNYFEDMARSGFAAELSYLDSSSSFFWVPPGYSTPITFDSVARVLKQNSPKFQSIKNVFDSLYIVPLNDTLATYAGRLHSKMTDRSGKESECRLMESGLMIRRKTGWKLLSGQTAILN